VAGRSAGSRGALFAGVMSGTSLDGADAALVDFSSARPRTLAFATVPFEAELRRTLFALSSPGADGLDIAGAASTELAQIYARAVIEAVAAAGKAPGEVTAIGCHGQTVRHRPERGFTIQLNDPARVAELTGIDVAADFRRRDLAAGGEGAPLAPAFHEAVFREQGRSRIVINMGGISNITWLPAAGATIGFDCGPGNVLLDGWIQQHQGVAYDVDGRWAASGRSNAALLERLLRDAFFDRLPPKSTGRELFSVGWLQQKLAGPLPPADVQATLTEFTAHAIVSAIDRFCPGTEELFLAGGGARNAFLVSRIRGLARSRRVALTDELGVPTGQVEAVAFAWLAMKCVRREPIDLSAVTGARGPRVLGGLYPA
jgi:anhydro-N-acetylmuramic acid kinase